MNTFQLPEVWISSIEHLDKMTKINSENKWWKQIFGIQKIDPNFPQIKTSGFSFPVAYFSKGQVKVIPEKLEYSAEIFETKSNINYKNIQDNLNFDLKLDQIDEISIYKYPKPYLEKFNYPWVSLKMKNGKTILICSAMKIGQIENGLKETATLYHYIQNYVA
ncbi:hypothetical protein [Flavobacterium marginilacus]|uniref:hypothetical protein n=1 Tax=Flavobacterium marginilacus TaxID=3003256 RepID=UPI00248EA32F|nr:hypothetical protein [Flavobacterium marginilacus]